MARKKTTTTVEGEVVEVVDADEIEISDDITPAQYFERVKSLKETTSSETMKQVLALAEKQLDRCKKLKQDDYANQYMQYVAMLSKEVKILEAGFTKYVSTETIKQFIHLVKDKSVYICEIQEYTRDIPDDVYDLIADKIDLFDHIYIMFTDYTQELSKGIAESSREKDPIMFGAIDIRKAGTNNYMVGPRWYFIADWVEPNCHLTLAEMIKKFDDEHIKEPVVRNIKIETHDRATLADDAADFLKELEKPGIYLDNYKPKKKGE